MISFLSSLMAQVALKVDSVIPDGEMHYLVPGQVPIFDEPDNMVVS